MKSPIKFALTLSVLIASAAFAAPAVSTAAKTKKVSPTKSSQVSADSEEGAFEKASPGDKLLIAAEEGDLDSVEALLKAGADINSKNQNQDTPVWVAAYAGHAAVVKLLIDKGAKVDQINPMTGDCLIHIAVQGQLKEIVAELKSKTPQCLTRKNKRGRTPVETAEYIHNKELAQLLAAPAKTK